MRNRRTLARLPFGLPFRLLFGLLFVASACGIQPDARPTEIERVDLSAESTGLDATGQWRVYFVAPGELGLLRSVPRSPVSRKNLIEILFQGPIDQELKESFSTSIPSGTEVTSVQTIGSVLSIDVSDQLTNITGATLTRALAQIVYTATGLDGIEAVQILVGGEKVAWPTPSGASKSELRVYDFPDAVETGQPDYPAQPAQLATG